METLGDSGKVYCPLCNGEALVLPEVAQEYERAQTSTVLRDQIDNLLAQVSQLSAENAQLRNRLSHNTAGTSPPAAE